MEKMELGKIINDEQDINLNHIPKLNRGWFWSKIQLYTGGIYERLSEVFYIPHNDVIVFKLYEETAQAFMDNLPDYISQGISIIYSGSNHYKLSIEHLSNGLNDPRVKLVSKILNIKICQ